MLCVYFLFAAAADGAEAWIKRSPASFLSPRRGHTAIWTGNEMIVWGGLGQHGTFLSDGGRFNPSLNTWGPVTQVGAPSPRSGHTAAWTGAEMIVWGGWAADLLLATGGRYNPATDTWAPVTLTNKPTGRVGHTAIWTGSEMVLWAGLSGFGPQDMINNGGRYNPITDTWLPVSIQGSGGARQDHTAVWTGSEMLLWGGHGYPVVNPLGARYVPSTDVWASINATGGPGRRVGHSACWTGSEMIVWGGYAALGQEPTNQGARYNAASDNWLPVTTTDGTPSGRVGHTAVWTGSEMIVWGGSAGASGGRYTPATDRWVPVVTTGAPPEANSEAHTAIWTGSEMIIWGGPDTVTQEAYSYMLGSPTSQITGLLLDGASLTIRFTTEIGSQYSLSRTEVLSSGNWSASGLPMLTGTGNVMSFTVTIGDSSTGFFRVQTH